MRCAFMFPCMKRADYFSKSTFLKKALESDLWPDSRIVLT